MPGRERLVSLLKEPIVPFLLVGAGLFAMQAWWSSSGGRASSEIVVSDEQAVTMVKALSLIHISEPTRPY